MVLVVPFDGSELSKAALIRAAQFEELLGEGVVAVSVIPRQNTKYARERGWLDADEDFNEQSIRSYLRRLVTEIAPDAEFTDIFVDHNAPRGTIANTIRNFARSHNASIVFLGSENAGRIVTALTVGRSIAADPAYDTMVISAVRPSNAEKLKSIKPTRDTLN